MEGDSHDDVYYPFYAQECNEVFFSQNDQLKHYNLRHTANQTQPHGWLLCPRRSSLHVASQKWQSFERPSLILPWYVASQMKLDPLTPLQVVLSKKLQWLSPSLLLPKFFLQAATSPRPRAS
jgi:hypothetical protein